MRGALVRAIEWRARRFEDPAHRLQFLRRRVGEATRRRERRRGVRTCLRYLRLACVIVVTLGAVLQSAAWFRSSSRHVTHANGAARPSAFFPMPARPETPAQVWLVQTTPQFDLYSNGLRIEERYATSTAARRYVAFAADRAGPIAAPIGTGAESRTEPAGIVYHTTESHLAPFEEKQNESLRRSGEGLLEYVSRRRSYHFVIDRFGRVFRIVRESDYANHAGNSVWADQHWIYINLNQSFFGVAFEARSQPSGAETTVNAAQIYAGRVLTQMLRARYGIEASNCVAHAQVSVNPENFGVGYHQDWAANLPFGALGLTDNYGLAPASVKLFGFSPPEALMETGDSSMARGLQASESELRSGALAQDLPLERYRKKLQERYRDAIRALRGKGAYQEYN